MTWAIIKSKSKPNKIQITSFRQAPNRKRNVDT